MRTSLLKKVVVVWCCLFGLSMTSIACGGNSAPVKPTALPLQYLPAPSTFQTALGWNVQITKASISVASIRLFGGKVAYAWHSPKHLQPWMKSLLPWREAWAHPGHYEEGSVKAELAFNQNISLVGQNPVSIGVMNAFTGSYGSGEVVFQQHGQLVLEGRANKDSTHRTFSIELPLSGQSVASIAAIYDVSTKPTTVGLRMYVERWFDLVEFQSAVIPATSGSSTPPMATFDEPSSNILKKAILSTANYSFQWATSGT